MTAQQRESLSKWAPTAIWVISLAFSAGVVTTELRAVNLRLAALEQVLYETRSLSTRVALCEATDARQDQRLDRLEMHQ